MRLRPAAPAAAGRLLLSSFGFLASLGLPAGCWTDSASSSPRTPGASASDPQAPCPTRLVAILHDRATRAPLSGATVLIATDRGRVAYGLTDATGRFETAAVRPPAKLVIYSGETVAESPLIACQPPLRLAVDLAR
jgi:hypothetical protein